MSLQSTLIHNKSSIPGLFRKVLTGWLLAVAAEYWLLPGPLRNLAGLEGLAQMSFLRVIVITGLISLLLFGISCLAHTDKVERWMLTGAFTALMAGALVSSFTWALLGACVLIAVCLVIFGIRGWNSSAEPAAKPEPVSTISPWIVGSLAVAFILLVSVWLVSRILCFSTSSFDFGLFSQMFYYMKESGLPMTTLERDGLLSHFAVHVSPIYYLMLPVYWLFPFPATLQVLQAVVLASAVFPLWKIGKRHGLSDLQRVLICSLLLLYPAYAGGTGYDIHENCFLTPLILWLFYGIDRKNTPLTFLAAALTLMVKEDAAVYVAVSALWLIIKSVLRFKKRDMLNLLTGISLLLFSLAWFLFVTGYLAKNGDGVMTYRYKNFMYDGSDSLMTVIKSVILNPLKAVYECVDPEKLSFIGMTLLPLLGLPLLTRRYERYLLLIPYILVNLMSDYQYQHNIFFQYTYGSTAFLIYLTAINLADLKISRKRVLLLSTAVAVAVSCFGSTVLPKATSYPRAVIQNHQYYQRIRRALDTIPEDASVTAHTFYTPHLSQRKVVYDLSYCSIDHLLESEYVVIQRNYDNEFLRFSTGGKDNGYDNLRNFLESNGYVPDQSIDDGLMIYIKK